MALSEADARDVARGLLDVRAKECRRLDEIRRYVRGEVIRVFRPRRHTRDYAELVDMARTNVIPLVVSTFAENLAVTGFKPAKAPEMSPAWDRDWQTNRMDARQSALWRTAIEYGLSYASVLPGRIDDQRLGLISLWSPRQCTAVYDDPIGDEWPVYFITVRKGWDAGKRRYVQRVTLTDDELLYHFIRSGDSEDTLVLDEGVLGVATADEVVQQLIVSQGDPLHVLPPTGVPALPDGDEVDRPLVTDRVVVDGGALTRRPQ